MRLGTMILWSSFLASASSGFSSAIETPSQTRFTQTPSCSGPDDWGTQGQLRWWRGFFLSPTTIRVALMLPTGDQTPRLVSDTVVCSALRNRIDSIATAEDNSYASLDLNRSIVVLAVDTVYVTADPLHSDSDRRRVHYVFTARGAFLKEFRLVQ